MQLYMSQIALIQFMYISRSNRERTGFYAEIQIIFGLVYTKLLVLGALIILVIRSK